MSRILYFECKTGAAGDMLMGALYELLPEEQKVQFIEQINSISELVSITPVKMMKSGIGGTHMKVMVMGKEEGVDDCGHHHHNHSHDHSTHNHSHDHDTHDHQHESSDHHHHHAHTSYGDVLEQMDRLNFSPSIKKNASAIYKLIGEAESTVHRTQIDQVHFHEIGTLDALVDVVGCCIAIDMLSLDRIVSSPVCIGNGRFKCAHGILPVPAPATAEIIKGMPVYSSSFDGELLTPTGAAILKHFVSAYDKQVAMTIREIGYGMGTKEFEEPTFVRAFLGDE